MATSTRRILGIDPGSRVTGYGVVDVEGQRLRHVTSGCITIPALGLGEKLRIIYDGILDVIDAHEPAEIALEQVFIYRNAGSALKLGQARGAAAMAGVNRRLELFEYTPNKVKQAVTGRGHADKAQVQHMVKVLLCLPKGPSTDAADALAVAICHGHVGETLLGWKRGQTPKPAKAKGTTATR